MAIKQKTDYFDRLINESEYSLEASKLLKDFLRQYSVSDIFEIQKEIKSLRNSCKAESEEIFKALETEFLPPLDREDIYFLSRSILKVTDTFFDVFQCIYIYNPYALTQDTVRLFEISFDMCTEMHKAICEMKNYRKRDRLQEKINACLGFKENLIEAYETALRSLLSDTNDMRKILSFTKIYDSIRKCFAECEETVLLIETVVMKNV